jgi:hypothetical protein
MLNLLTLVSFFLHEHFLAESDLWHAHAGNAHLH